ncbi:MAG: AAA domain-containing protein [Thiohalomonadales bacterium]
MFGSSPKRRLVDLLNYVHRLGQMNQEPVFSVSDYGQFYYEEHQLDSCEGMQTNLHDDEGAAIWLKIERLKRTAAPEIPKEIADWVSVSQDPYQAVRVKDAIVKTLPEQESIKLVKNGVVEAEDVEQSFQQTQRQLLLKDVTLKLAGLPETKANIEHYINHIWYPWANSEKPKRQTIKVYDAFFSLQQTLESQGDEQPLELVWGVGVTRWQVADKEIDYPLIEKLIEIELDNRSGAILIRPRSSERSLAIGPYFALDNPGVEALVRFEKRHFSELIEDLEFSPFVLESYEPLLRQAATQLHESGIYWPDINPQSQDRRPPTISDQLQVSDCSIIFARPRGATPFIQDIERFQQLLDDFNEDDLPLPTRRLVEELSNKKTILGRQHEEPIDVDVTAQQELYFPKPYNDAQVQIIDRLENNYGVVVQGPPGTGKTHTIANIISHYLSTGRRVLVTSSGESALTALREQIPVAVRELTISLLTNERQGLKQLESAVQLLATIASQTDLQALQSDTLDFTQQVQQLRQQIQDTDAKIRESGLKQLQGIAPSLLESATDMTAMSLAEKLMHERPLHSWFPDTLGSDDNFVAQFENADIKTLRNCRKSIGAHLAYIDVELPPLSELPNANQMAAIHSDLVMVEKLSSLAKTDNLPAVDGELENVMDRANASLATLTEFLEKVDLLKQNRWLYTIFQHWANKGLGHEGLSLLEAMLPLLTQQTEKRSLFIKNPIYIPDPGTKRKDLDHAIENLADGERAFGLLAVSSLFGKGDVKAILAQIEINGDAPTSARQWQLVEDYLQFQDEARRFIVKWNSIGEEYDLPELHFEFGSSMKSLKDMQTLIEEAKTLALDQWKTIATELSELIPYDLRISQVAKNGGEAKRALGALANHTSRISLSAQRKRLANVQKRLGKFKGKIIEQFRHIAKGEIGNSNVETVQIQLSWQGLIDELKHLHELQPKFELVRKISQKISDSGGKKWAARLLSEPYEGEDDTWLPSHCMQTWLWHRQFAYIEEISQHEQIKKLSKQRTTLENDLKAAFSELVRLKTHMGLHSNLTERVHGALVRFVSAISKLGKGTGKKRAPRFRREAHNAMQECFDGVPCWVMPTWRISESLPSEFGSFDLVIIDEASQSDITALPAILRAEKLLIVGDDKQVSPTAAFISEDKIQQLKQNYLRGQPFADLLIPGVSLYDLASSVYPTQRIMLTEHFRCVEAIIRFSMQFYNDALLPLRLPKASEKIDPPLVDVYIKNGMRDEQTGLNPAEILAIVDEVRQITQDPAFKGRSIGVISLIGSEQAHAIQDALLQELGEEIYQNFKIACGDSATFQGKEKDIIFLSMVVGPKQGSVLNKREYAQRFNVALSRARDRMYLYRSVSDTDLKNSNDLRLQVIRHFNNPMPAKPQVGDPLDLCQSQFERDIYMHLSELGYAVSPQVKVGPFVLDLVVEGARDQRLAIELDGDKTQTAVEWANELGKQRTLERVGWVFWRCWGASYTIDKQTCIADLMTMLKGLGITPTAESEQINQYTEFREFEWDLENTHESQ